jgi:hypothetical protein
MMKIMLRCMSLFVTQLRPASRAPTTRWGLRLRPASENSRVGPKQSIVSQIPLGGRHSRRRMHDKPH